MKHINIFTFCIFLFGQNIAIGQFETNDDVFVTNELTVNSDHLEFSPTFYEDGILFITTQNSGRKFKVRDTRINKNIMSIYNSRRGEDGKLQKPEPFAIELLSTVHEGPVSFDRTADNIFFTRNNYEKNKRIKAKDGIVKMQIYSALRENNVWQTAQKLSFNDKNSNAAHPSISVENDLLFFASDRPGGIGGMDLYVSKKIGDDWGEPINLGPKINTEKDEVFPFIHADGTLYFASDGNAGMGGLDLFSTTGSGSNWEIPKNLGKPFNSDKDDFGLIIDRDKKNGYFSSSRSGGMGQDDIYSFFSINGLEKVVEPEPEIEKVITINVLDEETGTLIENAKVTYMKLDETTLGNAISDITASSDNDLVLKLPLDGNSSSGFTDGTGQFPITLNRGNYAVKIEKEGYAPQQITVNGLSGLEVINVAMVQPDPNTAFAGNDNGGTPDGSNSTENGYYDSNGNWVPTGTSGGPGTGNGYYDTNGNWVSTDGGDGTVSSTIGEGTVIELPNIYYNFNESSIRPDARKDLDALYDFLNKFPDIEIELASHTDSRGGDRYNRRLSQKRADRAVEYLVNKGISRSRMVSAGHGENHLRNGCSDGVSCSETEHQYNRRTEVVITKMLTPITVKFVNNDPEYISEAPASVQNNKYRGAGGSTSSSSDLSNEISSSQDPNYNPDGRYRVIAGAYSTMKNAESKLERVRLLGYNNADIQTDGTLYHVVVGRYSNSQYAASTVKHLKGKSIRSYIKR